MTDAQLVLPFEEFLVQEQITYNGILHFATPQSDNECLLEYQYQYKVNGNETALDSFYRLGKEVCSKFISVETAKNRKYKHLSMEERREKAEDAITYVVSALIRKKRWFIKKSVTGYLFLRVQHELKYKRKVDDIVDFVDLALFFKEGEEDEED